MNRPMSLLNVTPASVVKILSLIEILPDAPDSCWLWRGALKDNGYGFFSRDGRQWIAHRTVYFLFTQHDPGVLLVCHKCDVRHCCNPRHMFLGTHDDNQKDMARKGRSATGDRHSSRTKPERMRKGEDSPKAKLTEAQVNEIRRLYLTNGYTQDELAELFNASQNAIHAIVRGKSWRHLQSNVPELANALKPRERRFGESNYAAKLTDAEVQEIRGLLGQGETGRAIAARYGVTDSAIYSIKSGRRRNQTKRAR